MKKLISLFKKLFLGGEVVEKVPSPINGEILVVEELSGKKIMRVGGIVQSGGMVEKIWQKSLSNLQYPVSNIKSILILGLGCGTVAEIINQKWPKAQITGLEIDKEVLKIGKKYFNLGKISNLSIVNEDALWWITSKFALMNKQKYDLILVDLYKGHDFLQEAESDEFLEGLKKLLDKKGNIIFNRLNFSNHKIKTAKFLEKLKEFSLKITTYKTKFNLFIICGFF